MKKLMIALTLFSIHNTSFATSLTEHTKILLDKSESKIENCSAATISRDNIRENISAAAANSANINESNVAVIAYLITQLSIQPAPPFTVEDRLTLKKYARDLMTLLDPKTGCPLVQMGGKIDTDQSDSINNWAILVLEPLIKIYRLESKQNSFKDLIKIYNDMSSLMIVLNRY